MGKDATDVKFDEMDRRYEQRFNAQEEAVKKAEAGIDRRLESMNEFRAALADSAASHLTRAEYLLHHEALIERLNKHEMDAAAQIARAEGKKALSAPVMTAVGGVVTAVLIALILAAAGKFFPNAVPPSGTDAALQAQIEQLRADQQLRIDQLQNRLNIPNPPFQPKR